MGRGHQGVQCTTNVAFGFSIKASASPGGPRVAPQVPPAVVPLWAPLSTEAVLAGSLPPRGWLKVLGAWDGGWGCPSSAGDAHAIPEGLLFEDVVNEQLTRQEHAEQEPRAGTVQEARGRCLPGLCRGAQHGREMPGMIGHRSSAGASPGRMAHPCPRVQMRGDGPRAQWLHCASWAHIPGVGGSRLGELGLLHPPSHLHCYGLNCVPQSPLLES